MLKSRSKVMILHAAANKEEDEREQEELDQDEHIALLDRNLRKYTQKGLLDFMQISEPVIAGSDTSDDNDEDGKDQGENKTKDGYFYGWQDEVHLCMRFSLLSHGSINGLDGPENNYANFGACSAFELPRNLILSMPAARMAPPGMDQESWSYALQELREGSRDMLEEYQGYRCTLTNQRRFYIRDALVWNCYKDNGEYYGQAMLFDRERVAFADNY